MQRLRSGSIDIWSRGRAAIMARAVLQGCGGITETKMAHVMMMYLQGSKGTGG